MLLARQGSNPQLPDHQLDVYPTEPLRLAYVSLFIAPDKKGYPHNIFLISPPKHMLWVLIRSEVLLMSTHNMSSQRGISDE